MGKLRYLVLDEADRLLDQGFIEDLTTILELLTKRAKPGHPARQTALVSATLSEGVTTLAGLSLRDPLTVSWKASDEEERIVPRQLEQRFLVV